MLRLSAALFLTCAAACGAGVKYRPLEIEILGLSARAEVLAIEVFDAWPRADVDGGQIPDGTYRFVVDGRHRAGSAKPYTLASETFQVTPWEGLRVADPVRLDGGLASFTTAPVLPAPM